MRCSAYEGCQLQVRRGADFFFLKAFPVFIPFPVFPGSSVCAAGREFPNRAGYVPVTSSYSSITLREPMMSCLTWGNRFGRRAPHLTDDPAQRDQLQRRAARHPAVKFNFTGKSVCKVLS
jgi:hypothetical protein